MFLHRALQRLMAILTGHPHQPIICLYLYLQTTRQSPWGIRYPLHERLILFWRYAKAWTSAGWGLWSTLKPRRYSRGIKMHYMDMQCCLRTHSSIVYISHHNLLDNLFSLTLPVHVKFLVLYTLLSTIPYLRSTLRAEILFYFLIFPSLNFVYNFILFSTSIFILLFSLIFGVEFTDALRVIFAV